MRRERVGETSGQGSEDGRRVPRSGGMLERGWESASETDWVISCERRPSIVTIEAIIEVTGDTEEAGDIIEVTTEEATGGEEVIEDEEGEMTTFRGGLMTGNMTSTIRTKSPAAQLTREMEEEKEKYLQVMLRVELKSCKLPLVMISTLCEL